MSQTDTGVFPPYAPVKDVAAWFGLSRSTQYRMLERGEIEALKIGRTTLIVTASVERYLAKVPRLGKQSA